MKTRCLLLCLLTIVAQSVSRAQETPSPIPDAPPAFVRAWFSADKQDVLIGEPITLWLRAEINPQTARLVSWPDLPEDWPPFDITEKGEVVENDNGGLRLYEQKLAVALWRPDSHLTPETYISYQQLGTGAIVEIPVQSLFFTVTSVIDGTDLDLHPLKPPIWLPYTNPWVIVFGGLFFLAVSGGGIWWLYTKRRSGAPLGGADKPLGEALAELNRLRGQGLPAVLLYPLVADCLRTYIQRRYTVRAQDMTTAELMESLDDQGYLPDKLQRELHKLLEQADLVKFASFRPGQQTAQRLLLAARAWLERADSFAPIEDDGVVE